MSVAVWGGGANSAAAAVCAPPAPPPGCKAARLLHGLGSSGAGLFSDHCVDLLLQTSGKTIVSTSDKLRETSIAES